MDDDVKKTFDNVTKTTNGVIKGNKFYHLTQGKNYTIKVNNADGVSNVVNILDKTLVSAKELQKATKKGVPPVPKGDWIFRFDKPHGGAEYPHININSHISGRPDPHIPLPPGGIKCAEGVAKTCKVINKVNKVAVPLAIAADVVQTSVAVSHDIDNGTTRNTVETVASVAGGWGGGYGGAAGGAALGTFLFPGIGTIVGGIVGGIGGGIGGSFGASALVDFVGDELDYDVEVRRCENCGRRFKARIYKGKRHTRYCEKCSN